MKINANFGTNRQSLSLAIVGGGLGGLLLARILHLHGISCTVFEEDRSPASRHQGGMLDIHEDTGQAALRAAGLHEEFLKRVLPGGDALRIVDKHGAVRLSRAGRGARPEIDRGSLRRLLIESLPEGAIRWNSKVRRVARNEHGFVLSLADGHKEMAGALVGADGAWSKVRPLLSPAVPAYTGVSFVELRYLRADRAHPEALRTVGDGLLFALSDEKAIIGHREPADELCVYAACKAPEPWQAVTRSLLREQFAGWHPDFHAMLERSDGGLQARPLYALPVGHRWPRTPGVTLIGDAAHLMSPFAGEGANQALADGADLAEAVIAHADDLEGAFAAYEARMFPRAEQVAAESADNLQQAFAPDALEKFLAFFGAPGADSVASKP